MGIKKKDLISMITESVCSVINEGVSSRVFHFLPLPAMYSISQSDTIFLSTSDRQSDTRMSNGHPYYLSLSRTPSSLVGYSRIRISGTGGDWKNVLVRIEFDGNKLNADFKGYPVNYFTDIEDSKIKHDSTVYAIPRQGESHGKFSDTEAYPKVLRRIGQGYRGRMPYSYKQLDRNQMLEYEDRIISNKDRIVGISRYIKRIDILIKGNYARKPQVFQAILSQIGAVLKAYGDKVNIYNSEVAFNSLNIEQSVTDDMIRYIPVNMNLFKQRYGTEMNAPFATDLTSGNITTFAQSFYIVGFLANYLHGKDILSYVDDYIKQASLEKYRDAIINNANIYGTKMNVKIADSLSFSLLKTIDYRFSGPKKQYRDFLFNLFKSIEGEYASLGIKDVSGDPTKIGALVRYVITAKARTQK